jgi:DNA repair protein RecO (recombination protein O)
MNQLTTTAIVLSRTDYGEADRILTLLTPDHGKLRLMARGVRRVKSKLAGGIELFSVSSITFMRGRGDIGTLVSARLNKHYGKIVAHIERTMLGYELLKQLNRLTEDEAEAAYFTLMERSFAALDAPDVPTHLIHAWFMAQLLQLNGHSPELRYDAEGRPLAVAAAYDFVVERMAFVPRSSGGHFSGRHVKALRLLFGDHEPSVLYRVGGLEAVMVECEPLVALMYKFMVGA